MKIVVLNGSPKGDLSVTMQYIAYIKKKFPDNEYSVLNVALDVRKIEAQQEVLDSVFDEISKADLVIWAFPLYYMLVCSQYRRFIEIITERGKKNQFAGKYTASFSTSIHFFDHTAHAYIHAICDDLGMKYIGGYSAEMADLLAAPERVRLEKFVDILLTLVLEKIPVPIDNSPIVARQFEYVPGLGQKVVDNTGKRVIIVADSLTKDSNLKTMVERVRNSYSRPVELICLSDIDIRGGCLGCCQCGYDNTCIYSDGYKDFFNQKLRPADIIILAGEIHDRYLSSAWKRFFDRSFFNGHVPSLAGKQLGFIISGPFGQIPNLREILAAWADNGRCNALFVSDEVSDSHELDTLIDGMATRLVQGANLGYIPPQTFYAVGGHKIFRDGISGRMRLVFQADYRYYREHGLLDFPQGDLRTRLENAVLIPLTRIPGFRKQVFSNLKRHMVEPFKTIIGDS